MSIDTSSAQPQETVESKLRSFVAEEIGAGTGDTLADDAPLRDSVDSMGLLEIVSFVESEFGVVISNEELVPANFDTIGDIARLVRSKQ